MEDKVIRKLATNLATYRKGIEHFQGDTVQSFAITKAPSGVSCKSKIKDDKIYQVAMVLDEKGKNLVEGQCTCSEYLSYPGICKHMVATLLQYNTQGSKRIAVSAAMPNETPIENLIATYSKTYYEAHQSVGEQRQVQLVPELIFQEDSKVQMRLSIGEDKLYVIKDIGLFTQDLIEEGFKEYGKNLAFRHTLDNFEERSRALAAFLIKRLKYKQKTDHRFNQAEEKKEVVLNLVEFDELFEIYKNTSVLCQMTGSNELGEGDTLKFVEQAPPIEFVLQEQAQTFSLEIKEEPLMLLGQGSYVVKDKVLYKVTPKFIKEVWPLLEMILKEPSHQVTFDKHYLPQIAQLVLPQLRDKVEMQVGDESREKYIPKELDAKLYIDLPQEQLVTLRVEYNYGEEVFNPLQEHTSTILRETYKEKHIEKIIEQFGFKPSTEDEFAIDTEDKIYTFITQGIEELLHHVTCYSSERLKKTKVKQVKSVAVGVNLTGDLLNINLDCIGIPKEELADLLKAYKVKRKYYRLKDGAFIHLQGEGIEDLSNVVEGLNLTDHQLKEDEVQIPKYRALYLERLLKEKKLIKPTTDKAFKTLIRDFDEVEDAEIMIPEHLEPILRSYQVTGYKWLGVLGEYGFGGILADDMGLGKTLQVISVLSAQQSQEPSLIVCPTSLAFNWVKEFEKFAPHIKVMAMVGPLSEREEKFGQMQEYDVIITSYELLKRDLTTYLDHTFNYCIIDEAQYIKNSQTQNAKAVKEIKSSKRIALTGTPIENNLSELWSIFDFIMPGYLFSHLNFRRKLESPIVKDGDEDAAALLKKLIAPFILRRLKKEVLEELPDKTESVVYCEFEQEQHKVYVAQAVQAKEDLMKQIHAEGFEKSHIKMLACLTRLRQICCDPSLFIENYEGGSTKLDTCLELVRNGVDSGHKILLFSQFTSMLDIIAEAFKKEGISYSLLKGNVKSEKRMEMVDNFNTGDTSVFLISLKAGGVGLNLTSADMVIHYDPWWNLSAQNQATDRAYRIGQMNNVQVFKLITKGTIEEKIKEMQDKKQNLTDTILDTESMMINKLSQEEIMDLFDN